MSLRAARLTPRFRKPVVRRVLIHLQGNGHRSDASTEVISHNEADGIFAGGEVERSVVANPLLANQCQALRSGMKLYSLALGWSRLFAVGRPYQDIEF